MVSKPCIIPLRIVCTVVSASTLQSLFSAFQNDASHGQKVGGFNLLERRFAIEFEIRLHGLEHLQVLLHRRLAPNDSSTEPCSIANDRTGTLGMWRHAHNVRRRKMS